MKLRLILNFRQKEMRCSTICLSTSGRGAGQFDYRVYILLVTTYLGRKKTLNGNYVLHLILDKTSFETDELFC